eukprot:10008578-Ditylum_brightwellii.AAC.1
MSLTCRKRGQHGKDTSVVYGSPYNDLIFFKDACPMKRASWLLSSFIVDAVDDEDSIEGTVKQGRLIYISNLGEGMLQGLLYVVLIHLLCIGITLCLVVIVVVTIAVWYCAL